MPIHLRWELYPVPHEAGKAEYGGGYLEETSWWSKGVKSPLLVNLRSYLRRCSS